MPAISINDLHNIPINIPNISTLDPNNNNGNDVSKFNSMEVKPFNNMTNNYNNFKDNDKEKTLNSLKNLDLNNVLNSISPDFKQDSSIPNNYPNNQLNTANTLNISETILSIDFLKELPNKNTNPNPNSNPMHFKSVNYSFNNNQNNSNFYDLNVNKTMDFTNFNNILLNNYAMEDRFDPHLIKKQLRGAIIVLFYLLRKKEFF
jgi:hypothetical protein